MSHMWMRYAKRVIALNNVSLKSRSKLISLTNIAKITLYDDNVIEITRSTLYNDNMKKQKKNWSTLYDDNTIYNNNMFKILWSIVYDDIVTKMARSTI